MSLLTFPKRLKQTARIALDDWRAARHKTLTPPPNLSAAEQTLLADLETNGFAMVPGFWSREQAVAARDTLLATTTQPNTEFESGAYLRHGVGGQAYGEGITRIYHAEKVLPELAEFRHHPLPLTLAHAYYGTPFYTGLLIFQHNKAGTTDGGYHVDGYKREFKSFLYLDDVTEDNGPFTYLRGSHKRHWRRMVRQLQGTRNGSPTNFAREDLRDLLHDEVKLTAPAGTLLLADVRGFHFGSPQQSGARSVLVNYIMQTPGELQIGR